MRDENNFPQRDGRASDRKSVFDKRAFVNARRLTIKRIRVPGTSDSSDLLTEYDMG